MQVSPCLNPIRVFNESLGKYVHVPCGHCSACVVSKGLARKMRLQSEIAEYPVKYFVTLTYDNEHLPIAKYQDGVGYVHPCDCDYNGVPHSFSVEDIFNSDDSYHLEVSNEFGGIPVLSRRHMILFRKRFRYYINEFCKKNDLEYEPVYIYTVGEYGPTTFRPHYHILFGFRNRRFESFFGKCVDYAWSESVEPVSSDTSSQSVCRRKFGQTDIQRCLDDGACSYIAQYLNCVTHLPYCYRATSFRPFTQKTKVDSVVHRYGSVSLSDFVNELPQQVFEYDNIQKAPRLVDTPPIFESRYVPKFAGFSKVSELFRGGLYRLYEKYKSLSARGFADLLQSSFDAGAFLGVYERILCKLYYDKADRFKTVNNLVRFYYVSRRFCKNLVALGCTCKYYVSRICEYYSRKELYKLRKFYQLQLSLLEDPYSKVSMSDLFYLYYDTDESETDVNYYLDQFGLLPSMCRSVSSLDQFQTYKFLCNKIVSDTTKTKKRNDYFKSQGWKRPNYIPHLSKRYLKFL